MNKPLISVITVVYNALPTLEATILSVLEQQRELFDYWIIDGGSTDGSVEIIRRYEHELAGWISEPDSGIYDAMNKGIDRAKGDWLYFLGADDQLSKGIILTVSAHLNPILAAVYGDVIYDTGHIMHSKLSHRMILENTLHHQATFYNRSLFTDFRYDKAYRVISDYELNLQIYLRKLPAQFIPYVIATCGSSGKSSVLSSAEVNHLREKYVKNKVLNSILNVILNTYYRYFRTKQGVKSKLKKLLGMTSVH